MNPDLFDQANAKLAKVADDLQNNLSLEALQGEMDDLLADFSVMQQDLENATPSQQKMYEDMQTSFETMKARAEQILATDFNELAQSVSSNITNSLDVAKDAIVSVDMADVITADEETIESATHKIKQLQAQLETARKATGAAAKLKIEQAQSALDYATSAFEARFNTPYAAVGALATTVVNPVKSYEEFVAMSELRNTSSEKRSSLYDVETKVNEDVLQ